MQEKVIIRTAEERDATAVGVLVVDTWRETYAGIFPDDFFSDFTYEKQIEKSQNIIAQSSTEAGPLVAINAKGLPIGYAFGGANKNESLLFDSELHALYLLKSYQGQGIGKRLFRRVVEREAGRGSRSLFSWVVTENPARHFYEKMGGQNTSSKQLRNFGSKAVEETALGWPDIQGLMSRLKR